MRKVEIYVPDHEEQMNGLTKFMCPECGNEITAPFGGHVWTCHEEYGGCGAQFRPEKGFKRID